jgi:hypothetical protein
MLWFLKRAGGSEDSGNVHFSVLLGGLVVNFAFPTACMPANHQLPGRRHQSPLGQFYNPPTTCIPTPTSLLGED